MADRTTARFMLKLSSGLGYHTAHLYITSAFLNERVPVNFPIYVRQPRRSDGTFKQPAPYGRLVLNMYFSHIVGHVYLKAVMVMLFANDFVVSWGTYSWNDYAN